MKRWVRCLSCVRPHVCELRLVATERDVETPAVRVWGRSRNHSRHGRQCAISFQEHPMPLCMTHRVRKAAQHTHWTYARPRPRVEGSCEMGWMGEVETETSCARCGEWEGLLMEVFGVRAMPRVPPKFSCPPGPPDLERSADDLPNHPSPPKL